MVCTVCVVCSMTVVAWMRMKTVETDDMDFQQMDFSRILDSNAQCSGFHKQKFAGFRNPDYHTWGESLSHNAMRE